MQNLRELNFKLTKESLKKETGRDILIIQTIHTINELLSMINQLSTNLRERYSYYAPRLSKTDDITQLVEGVNKKVKEDMAMDLNNEDLNSMILVANELTRALELKEQQEEYLGKLTKEICPRTSDIATPIITARLMDRAGSLKHLAELPSSTIQVLGAEKALFRHLKTGAKAPKFGVIFAHPNVSQAKIEEKGKAARRLASEISKVVKVDYFSKKR